jgi:hypothetical protein
MELDDVKTGGFLDARINPGEILSTARVTSGIKVA